MKNKNILLILENHADKIVLGVIAVVSISLLWLYIVGNPYGVEVKGRKRSPAQIDSYVKKEADRLYAQLDKSAAPQGGSLRKRQTPASRGRVGQRVRLAHRERRARGCI